MASFYQLEREEDDESPEKKGAESKYYDDEGKFKWEA
jgi:hypothetical protein